MRFLRCFVCLALACGCAEGSDSDAGVDGGPSTRRDAGPRDDAGPAGCPSGQHDCGGGCIDDLENVPEVGCRLGCGEACPTPPDGVAGCSDEGTCTTACEPPFREMDGVCVCTPRTCEDMGFMCGAPDDGCGTALDCGACEGDGVCTDGLCACPEDDEEPNDNRLSPPTIGALTDSPDSEATFSDFTLHDADDEDWFILDISDDFDAGNPQITVILRSIPSGSNYDLAAYYVCGSGGDSSSCTSGAADNMIGRGCASSSSGSLQEQVGLDTECSGSDDGGRLYLRVTSATWGGSCAAYELHVTVN